MDTRVIQLSKPHTSIPTQDFILRRYDLITFRQVANAGLEGISDENLHIIESKKRGLRHGIMTCKDGVNYITTEGQFVVIECSHLYDGGE
jgi:hypothetical protein